MRRQPMNISATSSRGRGRRAPQNIAGICAAAAATVAALFAAPRSVNAVQEVIYDLRVAGGGGKSATVSIGAPTVNLELFAYVLDLNSNAADTGFNSAQGAWMSSNGGLLGNFSTA